MILLMRIVHAITNARWAVPKPGLRKPSARFGEQASHITELFLLC